MSIPEHMLKLSKQFISIPSTQDNPEALHQVLEIAKKELEGYFPIEEFESNGIPSILAHNTGQKTRHFTIILNAHLDVVPGKPEQFHPYEQDGKLYGRGAYDMKAAAAAMILLFKEIAEEIKYPLGLQLVTDEENYSKNTTQYQIKKGVRGEFVIAGENSGLQIKNQAKGTLWFTLQAKGRTAHGGYPWKGENALLKLNKAIDALLQYFPIPKQEAWKTTVNIAKIETNNTAFNTIPDNAVAYIDMRFVPEEKETILNTVKKIIPEDIELQIVTQAIPAYVDSRNTYAWKLQQSIEKITHQKGIFSVAHGISDIRFFNEVGCLGVEFGPIGANQHGDNEFVDIKSLEDYYQILKYFLLSL